MYFAQAGADLQRLDDAIYEHRFVYHTELFDYYVGREVSLRSTMDGRDEYRSMSMHDASVLVASQAKLAATTPLEEFTPDSPLVYFLVNNVRPFEGHSFLEALNTSTFLLGEESKDNLTQLNYIVSILAGVVVTLFCVLLLILLLPMVNRIDNSKVATPPPPTPPSHTHTTHTPHTPTAEFVIGAEHCGPTS